MGLTQTKTISWSEIKKHNYVVAHGKVYDAALYISQNTHHPPCIIAKFGTDCSRDYDQHRGVKNVWKKYQIGVVTNNN